MPDLIMLLVFCTLAGLLAGFLGGMLGIGGGVIVVPILVGIYSYWPGLTDVINLAIGTSLGTIIFTSLAASYAQIRRKAVDWSFVRVWALPLMIGSLGAAHVASLFSKQLLLIFISTLLFIIATILLFRWIPEQKRPMPGSLPISGIALGTGLSSGLAGIGGANILIPTLMYFNTPFPRAAAVASTLAVPVSIAGTLGFIWAGWGQPGLPVGSLGYVHLPAVAAVAVTSMIMAPVGVALAHKVPVLLLQRIFAGLLALTSGRLAWAAFFG